MLKMLAIFYKSTPIASLARWNVICTILSAALIYYAFKWTVGISILFACLFLTTLVYVCFLKFSGVVCTNKLFISQDMKPYRKSILITGCDTGFGYYTAKRLSERGFQVFACCLFPYQKGGKELSECSNIHTLRMDVSKEEDIILALEFVKNHLGENCELWAIVNNAGISSGSEISVTPIEQMKEVLDVNLLGTIRVTKAFLPLLQKSQGRIINIASAAGRFTMPGFIPYCVSKNGIICFSDGLRLEVDKFGISVITIEPWIYKTRLSDPSSISNSIEKQWSKENEKETSLPSEYVKNLQKNTSSLFSSVRNSNINEVIDVIEDAVLCKCPPYVYRPGHLYLSVLLWFLCILPKPIADYMLCNIVFKCA